MHSSFYIDSQFDSLLETISSNKTLNDSHKKEQFIHQWNEFVNSDECKTWEENLSALSWGTSSVGEMYAGKNYLKILSPSKQDKIDKLSKKFKFLYTAPAQSAAEDDLGWVKFERLSFPKIQTVISHGVNFSFNNCNFLYKATFKNTKELQFTACEFNGGVIVSECNKLKLNHSNLNAFVNIANIKEINFYDTVFNGYTSLDITNCQKLPNFAEAHFNNTQHLKIIDSRFEGQDGARFAVTQVNKQRIKKQETHKPADTYRFLKNYYAKDNHLKAKHAYFKLELKHTFPFWYWLYNFVSDCGLSIWRPLIGLLLPLIPMLLLGVIYLTFLLFTPTNDFMLILKDSLSPLTDVATNCWQGGNILIRTINPLYFKCHDATNIFSSFWLVIHTLWNGLMLFLIGLGLRNKLKLKH